MTTPSGIPANEPDCFKLEEGLPVLDGEPDRVTPATPVTSGARRPSTASEPDKPDTDVGSHSQGPPLGASEWGGSGFSLCSDNMYTNSSGRFSSSDSHEPDSEEDCAAVLLACLYCRFHDLAAMLPDTCERAVGRCFPSFNYIKASSEKDRRGGGGGGDCCSCSPKMDCGGGFCGSCQDTADLLELAMEVSEICYR